MTTLEVLVAIGVAVHSIATIASLVVYRSNLRAAVPAVGDPNADIEEALAAEGVDLHARTPRSAADELAKLDREIAALESDFPVEKRKSLQYESRCETLKNAYTYRHDLVRTLESMDQEGW